MDIDTGLLRRTALFHGMEDGDIRRLLDCLHCPVRRYGRGEFLWHAGDAVPMAGIVLSGCVDAVQYGEDGSRFIIYTNIPGAGTGNADRVRRDDPDTYELSPDEYTVEAAPSKKPGDTDPKALGDHGKS